MKINKWIIGIIAVIISVAWIYNIIIFMGSRIENPIFFRQNTDITEDEIINITYIENVNSNDPIVRLELPELGSESINIFNRSEFSDGNRSNKSIDIYLSEVNFKYNKNISDLVKDENLIITKLIYITTSGKREEVNIGKITIRKKFIGNKNYKILEPFYSGANGSNGGVASASAKDDISIIDIESENMEDIKRLFDVYIGRERLEEVDLPITVKRGDRIEVSYTVKEELSERDFQVEEYSIPLRLKCSDPEGTIDYIILNLEARINSIIETTNNKFIKNLNKKMGEN